MKITIVQGAFLPVPAVAGGAVEKLWSELAIEFARRGECVTHVSRRWPGQAVQDLAAGVAHVRVKGHDYPKSGVLAKLMDLAYSLRCLRAVKRSDVIVTNTFFLPLLLSLLPRRGLVYVSVHRYPQGQMVLYRKVDRLQCVSTAIADAVRDQTLSVAPLVKVVPNYVSTRLDAAELASGWSARRREVLFVGRVHPEKGIELLLEACARIASAARDGWTLRVVGPHRTATGGGGDAFLVHLKARAQALGVTVDWVGPIFDRDALNECYRRAKVFVYPSTAAKGEAFPLAPLEAMAQGCATVTSDLKCFDDFIHSGVNAQTFALDDDPAGRAVSNLSRVLEAMMADDTQLRRYAHAGLETVQRFSLESVADSFIADFHSLSQPMKPALA